jgi:hypothetical protein
MYSNNSYLSWRQNDLKVRWLVIEFPNILSSFGTKFSKNLIIFFETEVSRCQDSMILNFKIYQIILTLIQSNNWFLIFRQKIHDSEKSIIYFKAKNYSYFSIMWWFSTLLIIETSSLINFMLKKWLFYINLSYDWLLNQ